MNKFDLILKAMDSLNEGKPVIFNQVVPGGKNFQKMEGAASEAKKHMEACQYDPYTFEYYDADTEMLMPLLFAVYPISDNVRSYVINGIIPIEYNGGTYAINSTGYVFNDVDTIKCEYIYIVKVDVKDIMKGDFSHSEQMELCEKNIDPFWDKYYKFMFNINNVILKYINDFIRTNKEE